jgi:hypothetical protein
MEPSLVLLRTIGLLLTSDCAEEEESLRLRLRGLDIVEDGWCFVCRIVDADFADLKSEVICSMLIVLMISGYTDPNILSNKGASPHLSTPSATSTSISWYAFSSGNP